MPMNRYEIRNEYSLADPKLYMAADKDDPEALLEGVAMAGLVGVLRQLGDLAEFAAEIFHDLHEEVMATAVRGHNLMIRVQQLETEVPSIEKAFLSQTDHSPFFYNAGVDWHPNLQMDRNLITQGDLPRFVMDSYEECRGPPRLFLLDKFDVAGAGACLKRYTDPSFLKLETSATSADIQREKKIRKPKKKGPRWRNGETPEVLPMAHAKLHQLFLEEPAENGVRNPTRRAKLKRRLNRFPFDSKSGKSYMEKLLKTPSPEHKMLHEITDGSPLQLPTDDHDESHAEVLHVRSVSPGRDSVGRRSPQPPNKVRTDDKICEVPNSYLNTTDDIPSTLDEETGEKDIAVDGERRTEGSLAGDQSDETASEIDKYVDAPSTIESEMDTDCELRLKNDFTLSTKSRLMISFENEEQAMSDSQSTGDLKLCDEGNDSKKEISSFLSSDSPSTSDSQSTGDMKLCHVGNNSSKEEISSFLSSDSPSTSPENPQLEKMSAEGFPSADIPDNVIVDASSFQKTGDEHFHVDQLQKPEVSDNIRSGKDTLTNYRPDSEQLTSSLCITDSIPISLHCEPERVVREARPGGPCLDAIASTPDDEEKKRNVNIDSQCSPSVSDSESQSGDDSPRCSSGDHPVDEPNGESAPDMSTVPDIIYHATDSSAVSAYLLLHDGCDREDLNQFNTTNTLNMCDVPSLNRIDTAEMISTKKPITNDKDPKLPENFPSDHTDVAPNGDITSIVSNGEKLNDKFESENPNVVSDVSNHHSCIMEGSLGEELVETSLINAEIVNAEDHYSNGSTDNDISLETSIALPIKASPDWTEAEFDVHDRDVIPEEETAVHQTPELGSPKSCEVVGLQGRGITANATENDFVVRESSCHTPENLEDQAGTSDTAEKDGIDTCSGANGLEIVEFPSSTDPELLNEVPVLLDEFDGKTDQSKTAVMATSEPAASDNASRENVLPVDLDKLVEEHVPCFEDSGFDTLENDKNSPGSHSESDLVEEDNNYLLESHRQSGLVEEMDERKASISDLRTDFCSTINNENPKPEPELSHIVPNSYLDSGVEHSLDLCDPTQIQSPMGLSGLRTGEESFQQSGVENQVSNDTSSPIYRDTEEKMLQEKIELPPDQTDHELPDSGEISRDLSSLLPINDQQMLDHEDHKQDNDSVSSFSLVNNQSSVSELPGLRNYEIDVTRHVKGPLDFILPLSNLDESPPLPPLPPVQWRLGKLLHSSSTTDGATTKHKVLFPQEISLPTATTGDVSSSLEEVNHSLCQVVPETTLKEEKVDDSSSTLKADSMHEKTDLPPKIDNKHHQLVMPTSESEVAQQAEEDGDANGSPKVTLTPQSQIVPETTSKEEKVVHSSSTLEADSMHEKTDLPPKTENKHHQLVMPTLESEVAQQAEEDGVANGSPKATLAPPSQIVPGTTLKEEKVEHSSSTLEANSMHEEIDLPPKIENKLYQLAMPTLVSEVAPQAEEDGVANVSQKVKLPRPRNPLIDEVAALDKSKLRKVSERVRPQIRKADERDSILEQIRAKSFNLKPAAVSRPSSIRGPKTNLKVAAILEKANAIRQACAGSDDDEEDNWSDL